MRTLLFVTLLFLSNISFTQTIVPAGNVSGNWTLAGSPYQVQGLIVVQDSQSLIIDPGVLIEFASMGKLRIKGDLHAIGTTTNPITFTAQDTTVGWQSVFLDSVNVTSDSSIFEYCIVEYTKGKGLFWIINTSKVRIENSTLRNGSAYYGGAIYLVGGDPIFKNNNIVNNNATYQGGAFFISNANPTIDGNNISNNIGYTSGAAIFLDNYSDPIINNNVFNNNFSSIAPGIVCSNWADPFITNNVFSNNIGNNGVGVITSSGANPTIIGNSFINNSGGSDRGGALLFGNGSQGTVINNIFDGNSAFRGGAVVVDGNSIVTFDKNTFINNSSTQDGGALRVQNNSIVSIKNCIFSNNSSNWKGGAIYIDATETKIINCLITNNSAANGGAIYASLHVTPEISNCTVTNNFASNRGGAFYFYWSASPIIKNTIVWGNRATNLGPTLYIQAYTNNWSSPSFINCNIEGGQTGFELNGNPLGSYINNISAYPLFIAPSNGAGTTFNGFNSNWQIPNSSQCYNAGTPDTTGLNLPATDLAGENRVAADTVDIGAYEVIMNTIILSQTSSFSACLGDSVVLTVGAGGISPINYQWQFNGVDLLGANNDSLTLNAISVGDIGNYTCIINNINGNDTSSVIVIGVNPMPVLNTIGNDTAFCSGSDVVIRAQPGPFVYDWNNGLSSVDSLIITSSGSYYYSVVDTNGCFALSDSLQATMYLLPSVMVGNDTMVCVNGNIFTLNGSPIGGNYSGTGVVGTSFDPSVAGLGIHNIIYAYTDSNSCVNSDTIAITVDICSRVEGIVNDYEVVIYPNPINENISIDLGEIKPNIKVTITNSLGQVILMQKYKSTSFINLDFDEPKGIYFLQIEIATRGLITKKIIKE